MEGEVELGPRRLPHPSYVKAYPEAKARTLDEVREALLVEADKQSRWRLGPEYRDTDKPLPRDIKWNHTQMSSSGCVCGGSLFWPVWSWWFDHRGAAAYSDGSGRNSGNPELLLSWAEVYKHLRGEAYEQVELELFA